MRRTTLALMGALALALPSPARADAPPELELDYVAADPDAAAVTAESLLASERFWPYHAKLTEAWTPPGASRAIGANVRGVLVRVEEGGRARVDFGRDGVHVVPVEATDLVAEANRVRLGQRTKAAPNYVLAIGNRLTGPEQEAAGVAAAAAHTGFASLFIDPNDARFEASVRALAALDGRRGVKTVIFVQGRHSPRDLTARLEALGWKGYRMGGAWSVSYTEAQLDGEPPAVLLVTPDGRLVFSSAWRPGVAERLEQAIDASFADPARTASTGP
jgi:hypothetical protein